MKMADELLAMARAEERERCARAILNTHENNWCRPDWGSAIEARAALAEKIRRL